MKRNCRSGFSLLEVLLALGLSFVVLFGIAMAINLHLRMLDKRQSEIERSQLSRSVLRLIREDVHGAVQYTPFDTSALEELIAGIDPLAADLLAAEATGEVSEETIADAAAAASGDTGEEEDVEESTAAEDVVTSAFPPTRPGVYGNETSLSIDISRLPRRDQLLFPVTTGVYHQLPSDIKTVAYYIGEVAGQPGRNASQTAELQTGLIRREVDRAVSRYAEDNGSLIDRASVEDLIAPEVTQIYFSYYDGTDWLTQWDSGVIGRLPVAIQITIGIGGDNGLNQSVAATLSQQSVAAEVHQMIVYLPISEVPPEKDEEAQ